MEKRNKIIPYNPELQELARQLRKNSTLSEVLIWMKIKNKALGFEFHRQVPLDEFIVDFFCHELMLAIEIDGSSHDQKYMNDILRQKRLEELGVIFLRFTDKEVKKNVNDVVRGIEIFIENLMNDIPLLRGNSSND